MKHKKYVVWDWNGTLIDDAALGHRIFADICRHYQVCDPTFEDYQRFYQHPIDAMYRAAGFDFEKVPMKTITNWWHDHYTNSLGEVRLFDDAQRLLKTLHKRGVTQVVLSALPHEILMDSVRMNGVEDYFVIVQGLSDNLGRSKIDNGRVLLERLAADPQQVILFGDSSHDRETAQALEIDCILFSRGYEHPEKLARHNVPIYDSFRPIIEELGVGAEIKGSP